MSVEIKVPEFGESVNEVFIGEWHKSEGDGVEEDEELVELESDKATFDAVAPAGGVLSKIMKQSGETAEVGEVIGVIDEFQDGETGTTSEKQKSDAGEKKTSDESQSRKQKKAEQKQKPVQEEKKVQDETTGTAEPKIMPAARRLLEQHDLNPQDVQATGPEGRLLKEDVQRHISEDGERASKDEETEIREKTRREETQPGRQTETVPMSPVRRRIAQRLVEAQQNAALLTTFNEIDMTAVSELREKHKQAFQEKYKIKLGFMSFFVKAAVDALKQFPGLNAEVSGTDIIYHNYCDVGIAIGTEKGLVVPVLRNAERMSFAEIESAVDEFARRSRDGRLSIEELQGGTFTISNGGIYGSLLSTPIINPPQSGVLGMHAIQDRPVARDGQIVIRPMMYVALSYDHRIVDGREAVSFLRRIREAIEQPARMLMEI